MKNLVIESSITAKNAEEVKIQVLDQMSRFGYNVVENTYRITEIEQQFQVEGEMNGDWQTTISVSIESFDEEDERYYIVKVSED